MFFFHYVILKYSMEVKKKKGLDSSGTEAERVGSDVMHDTCILSYFNWKIMF